MKIKQNKNEENVQVCRKLVGWFVENTRVATICIRSFCAEVCKCDEKALNFFSCFFILTSQ